VTIDVEKPSVDLQAFLDWLKQNTNPHVRDQIARRDPMAIMAWLNRLDREGRVEIGKNFAVNDEPVSGVFKELAAQYHQV
jgi:hypothetical protein